MKSEREKLLGIWVGRVNIGERSYVDITGMTSLTDVIWDCATQIHHAMEQAANSASLTISRLSPLGLFHSVLGTMLPERHYALM